ncbi:GntR family transcriptional regulator [Ideonella livida]|uniref:GntR family transcriptional regulator n=1 Tax=Ideonella livida TaxID=2707176 RepID=A0A7C9PK27_9BURK|nr:GntR family transcriptional regulator [Ideonella livida]NDY93649.1 GntR family transcriptional regulator [Ideonella livida]
MPRRSAAPAAVPDTATQRVYDGIYGAIVEHRLAPGTRLREQELAEGFGVSRTVVRQALQRLAADQVIALEHNKGATVPQPDRAQAAQVFDARQVIEGDIARRLAGQLSAEQIERLRALVAAEQAAQARSDKASAVRLSGQFHRELAVLAGNPLFVRWIDELLPLTSLLILQYQRSGHPGCVTHRHDELIAALASGTPAKAAAEMRRHLQELARSLDGGPAPAGLPLRDLFAAYREG